MLYGAVFNVKQCTIKDMKLWYDRKSSDPTYFVQLGIRNGKKLLQKTSQGPADIPNF